MIRELINIFKDYNGVLWLILVVLSIFFEITPIKINPISWLGAALNKNTNAKIEALEQKIEILEQKICTLETVIDGNQVEYLRFHILDFANSIQNGRERGKEEYHNVMGMYGKYHNIIGRNNFPNDVLEESYKVVLESYHEKLKTNNFI